MATLNRKRRLDSIVGVALCAVLGLLTRIAWVFALGGRGLPRTPRKVLVIKLVGQGSITNATHLLRAVKEGWPGSELHFVGFSEVAPLVNGLADVDRMHVLDDRSRGRRARRRRREAAGMGHGRVQAPAGQRQCRGAMPGTALAAHAVRPADWSVRGL